MKKLRNLSQYTEVFKIILWDKLPVTLAVAIYFIIYFIRSQQGGWEVEINLFSDLRESLDKKISQYLPSPQGELLSGIVLGNKKDLPSELRIALRDTSTLHMVVVSGQNLTMLAGFFLGLSGLIRRKVAIVLSILAIVFYTLLTGAQIPVLRASIMAILAFTAEIFGRLTDGLRVLVMTAGFLLLINPGWLFDLSFQLSFLATFGVIVLVPIIEKRLESVPVLLRKDLAVTVGAQLMVIPIIAYNFHQFSLVGIFANVLISWTIPFIMILGPLMLMVGYIWQFGGWVIGLLVNSLLTYFIYIVQFFSSLPFAWEYVGDLGWIFWVGYYVVLGGIVIGINRK